MEIWLDTINSTLIQEADALGLISGVTTNPGILSQSPHVLHTLEEILSSQEGLLAVQITGTTRERMIEEGRLLFGFSKRILVKIPVNREGLGAIRQLVQEGVSVLGTAIIHPKQAFLAGKLGALYVAPYFSHIANAGMDPFVALQTMQEIFRAQGLPTKIMAASIKQVDHVMRCAQMGIGAVTLKDDVYRMLLENDAVSEACTNKLNLQWHQASHTSLV